MFIGLFLYGRHKTKGLHKKEINTNGPMPSVTILICAKNEEAHIQEFLPTICQQEYPNGQLKVFLVNDGSSDNTGFIFDEYAVKYDFINVLHIPQNIEKHLPGKKYALQQGIQLLDTDYVLLTDADCAVASPFWAKNMVIKAEKKQADVVLGLGRYQFIPSSWLNTFIQFETLHTAIQYASYALVGKSYMGVGRNLLYKSELIKSALVDQELLQQLSQTSSGDDDLIVSYAQRKNSVIIPYFKENSQTISTAPERLGQYIIQKSRHTSSAKYYASMTKALLGLYALSHALFWLGALCITIDYTFNTQHSDFQLYIINIYIVALCIKMYNYHLWCRTTNDKHNGIIYIICEPIWLIYNVILSPYIFWKNTFKWK